VSLLLELGSTEALSMEPENSGVSLSSCLNARRHAASSVDIFATIALMDVGCLLIVRTDLPPGEKLQNPPLVKWQYTDGRPVLQKPTYAFVTL